VENRDRRKTIATIFADTAKYSLTAGIIGGSIGNSLSAKAAFMLGIVSLIAILLAYFVTPSE